MQNLILNMLQCTQAPFSPFIIPDIPSIHRAAGFDFCLVLPGIPPQTRRAAEKQEDSDDPKVKP